MKKLVSLLLCLLLVLMAGSALAAEYNPGDTITMYLSLSNDSGPGTYTVTPYVSTGSASVSGAVTFTVKAKACTAHAWDDGKVTTEATCDKDGVKTYTCKNCGKTKTETIAAKGHVPGNWVETKPVVDDQPGEKQRSCTVCGKVLETAEIPANIWYHMTASSIGLRFRDVSELTRDWNMFTPIDLSVDGVQVYDLVAGNQHVIGEVCVEVANGTVTVSCKLVSRDIQLKSEFMTLLPGLEGIETLDKEKLTGYAFGEPISIADDLNGDTLVLLYICNEYRYSDDSVGLRSFYQDAAYEALVKSMSEMMD